MRHVRIADRLARMERALGQTDPRRLQLAERIQSARARCPSVDFDAPPTAEGAYRSATMVGANGDPEGARRYLERLGLAPGVGAKATALARPAAAQTSAPAGASATLPPVPPTSPAGD